MATDARYAYAVGRIRAVESRLLDRTRLARMAEAGTPEEAFRVIVEAGYGLSPADPANYNEYERLLGEELDKAYSLIDDISPLKEVVGLFLIKNDYHNLKVILKAEVSAYPGELPVMSQSTIPFDRLKTAVSERKLSGLHPLMSQAVNEALDLYNRTGDPQSLELSVDRACYLHMAQLAEAAGNSFISGLAAAYADLANIKTFLRAKKLGKPKDFLKRALVPAGKLEGRLLEIYDQPLETALAALKNTSYGKVGEEGIAAVRDGYSLTRFERLSDDYITAYAAKGRYTAFGPEPLAAYLIAKQTEIRNVRIIMVGKINGMSVETIRERLREIYA